MRSRLTKLGAALAALAALAVGGSTLASASGGGAPAKPPAGESVESGSETPGNDGPGGHADEPGNPNADTQQEGQN